MTLYHFAYQAGLASGGFGFGNWTMDLDHPIRNPDDLKWVAEAIRVANPGNTTVIILSWQKYEDA